MKTLIVTLLVVLVAAGIFLGIKDANHGLVGTASSGITAHNAEVERVAKEVGN